MLRKIWTTQYQRVGRAAYAEANDKYIDVKVMEIIAIMSDPAARFYRIEVAENGAFVGYFIVKDGKLADMYIRPHFRALYTDSFATLITETILLPELESSINIENLKI